MDTDSPSRERFEAALALKKHDRVPVYEFVIDSVNLEPLVGRKLDPKQALQGATMPEIRDVFCRLGFDLLPVGAAGAFYGMPEATEEGRFKKGGLETREDLERTEPPGTIEGTVEAAKQTIALAAEKNMGTWVYFFCPFTSTYCGMGIDRFWVKVCEDPQFIEDAFDKANDHAVAVMEAMCETDVTLMVLADDCADNNGLLLWPSWFRELWFPRMKRLLAPALAKGIPTMLHNCGNWKDMLPMADELGFTAIEPIQPTCNDIYQIKKDYGERFCILGNIDIAGVLAFGKPEEVRADVREHIDRLSGNGGYVVHSSHSIVDAIPHDNFLAMVDEARSYGRFE